jgi:hypothetical protein
MILFKNPVLIKSEIVPVATGREIILMDLYSC